MVVVVAFKIVDLNTAHTCTHTHKKKESSLTLQQYFYLTFTETDY